MPDYSPSAAKDFAYEEGYDNLFLPDVDYETFALNLPDDRLSKLLIDSLNSNFDYWNKAPWKLSDTDKQNVKFYLGEQVGSDRIVSKDAEYVDNRLFASVRAIVSYATGQLAMPELTPSRSDDTYIKMARALQQALYQHSANEQADMKFRAAVTNLVMRKRAFLKLRFDPNAGMYGDIVTEVVDPADIIVDREARFMANPNVMYHRLRKSIDEICAMFPKKQNQIYSLFNFKRGTLNQLNKVVTLYEAWFTYRDGKLIPKEGVGWFFHDPGKLVLDKMPNPNWVYTGDDTEDKKENVLFHAPKPFVPFNFLNLGHSYIDETTLFDQAMPMQKQLNKRLQQISENIDYSNGRWIVSKKAMDEQDAYKLINKGPKTVAMVKSEDVRTAAQVLTPNQLPAEAYETLQLYQAEIDGLMGTPSVFKGQNPQNQDTLGRDLMLKQQAGMLQDDLVRCVQQAYQDYYSIKLQMMRVYYTEDYWFQVKGGDGKFDFVMLNGDMIDSNVKIGVQVDSTLPLDKPGIRATAMELAKMNRIDQLTLMQDLGLPDPEVRTERFLRSQIDLYTYMDSIEDQLDSNEAEVDIMLLKSGKDPQERADYNENYLNYFNHFITTNEFQMLPQPIQQRLTVFLQEVTQRAQRTAQLGTVQLDSAGILDRPPILPLPKRTENIRLVGNMSPETTQQIAGGEAQLAVPESQLEQAQNPNQGTAPPQSM